MEILNTCKHFISLISLLLVHLKRAYEVIIFAFSKKLIKEFARVLYQIFIRGWKKCRLHGKFEIFIPG